ncbi:MAG: DNA internalization-related competence protein ComEC/Rec2 [Gammaproteobacteria bacterium]|nr:MAG: DNA internalization-related competence protein ComEC/Rec2 [Gammaproteobacteria bacterium]
MRSGTIALLSGIWLVCLLPRLPLLLSWPVGAALLLGLLLGSLRSRKLRLPLLFLAGVTWAVLRASALLAEGVPESLQGQDVLLSGEIVSIPEYHDRGVRFVFELHDDQPVSGRVRLSWYRFGRFNQDRLPELVPGQQWQLVMRLKRPSGFMNPGGFDYEGWLFQQHIRATGYVRKHPQNRLIKTPDPYHLNRLVTRLRQDLQEKIVSSLQDDDYHGQYVGLVSALAIGQRDRVSPQQWDVLRATGTSHLMAISGLHIGLVAMFIYFLTKFVWRNIPRVPLYVPAQKVAAIAALIAAVIYAALAGFSVPTQRALVMVVVMMLAVVSGRRVSPSRVLAIALAGVLILDPFAVLSAGFWLSFAAVAVILYGIAGRVKRQSGPRQWGRVQWIVFIGLFPLLLLIFQQASLVSPMANLFAVPWMGFVVVPLVLAGVVTVASFPALASISWHLAASSIDVAWILLRWLADQPEVLWVSAVPPLWSLLFAVLGVVWILMPRGIPGRWCGVLFMLPMGLVTPATPDYGEYWLTLLDVGQGLSVVVRTKNKTLVFDAGPRFSQQFDTGAAVVVPYLRHQGVKRIDRFIVSHGDKDHIGGAASVIRQISVDSIFTSDVSLFPDTPGIVKARPCVQGQQWQWDGVSFEILHPHKATPGTGNNSSCVLRINTPVASTLLPGDIERRVEEHLVTEHSGSLPANVLVAPHHGSNTSSGKGFIQAVSPDYVLFPAGYRNRFRHPADKVVQRYQRLGIQSLASDRHGAITLRLPASGSIPPPGRYRQSHRRIWSRY